MWLVFSTPSVSWPSSRTIIIQFRLVALHLMQKKIFQHTLFQSEWIWMHTTFIT